MLLRRSDPAGRVPAWALVVVRVLTLPPISVIKGQVNHCSYVQHCLEVLDLHVDLLTVFRQQGCELFDDHPRCQGIVCWRAVNLFSLVLNQPSSSRIDHDLSPSWSPSTRHHELYFEWCPPKGHHADHCAFFGCLSGQPGLLGDFFLDFSGDLIGSFLDRLFNLHHHVDFLVTVGVGFQWWLID
jgi:hypothetical protein